jgi:hypothetical protein
MMGLPRLDFIYAGATAILLSLLVGWHFGEVKTAREEGRAEIRAQWDQEKARIVAVALAASEEARQKEKAYVNAVESTRDHYARESAITKAAAARASSELERLRVAVAAVGVRPDIGGRSGAGAHQDARELQAFGVTEGVDETAGAIGVLLLACGGELQSVAREADELGDQVRGLHRHIDTLLERIAGKPPAP